LTSYVVRRADADDAGAIASVVTDFVVLARVLGERS
jgi:hypothetical protein